MARILDRLYNLHWVTPEVARSAQPYLGFYAAYLRPHGFRSLLNLRGENPSLPWWRADARAAAKLGMKRYDVRLSSRLIPARESLTALIDALERAPRPLLIKCSGGQDRTGLAAAIYLLHAGGTAALREAEAQIAFWPFLHVAKPRQRWLRHFPRFVAESAKTARISDWLRSDYEPQAFAEWLKARGHRDSFVALQTVKSGGAKI